MVGELLYDAHCHLTPSITPEKVEQLIKDQTFRRGNYFKDGINTQIHQLNLMSTNQFDVDFIDRLAEISDGLINPCFGIHPWYCHLFTFTKFEGIGTDEIKKLHYTDILTKLPDDDLLEILPTPIYFPAQLQKIEQLLIKYPDAMVGEIGIDKLFRVPRSGYLGNLDSNAKDTTLGMIQVKMDHQLKVYESLLQLAITHKRSVSVHCVKAHGILFDNTKRIIMEKGNHKKASMINICLHSYSGSVDQAKLWVKTFGNSLYFSLSEIINVKSTRGTTPDATRSKSEELLTVIPKQSVLTETDFGIDRMTFEEHVGCLTGIAEVISTTTSTTNAELLENWHTFSSM